jgi:pyridoxal phosphate enzyme (YggS family)
MSAIAAKVETVYRRIQAAAQRAGRQADDIKLVAVTKTHPLATVIEAYQAGLRHFGENRADEGQAKVAAMADWLAQRSEERLDRPRWHFIGHLQSRQVGSVLGQFKTIHSVDSLKLAQRINRLAKRDDFPPVEVFLECNVSGETSKYGFALERWSTDKAQLTAFLDQITQMESLEKIMVRGLMVMAPWSANPEDARPTFKSLAALRQRLQIDLPQFDWRHLSMGMTDDFEVAIEEGATIIRVGRALFGERNE